MGAAWIMDAVRTPRGTGLMTLCIGGDMGIATVIERV